MTKHAPRYTVSWTIRLDAESTEAAAHEALDILHDTYAGDGDALNIFVVTDRAADVIESVDLGDIENSTLTAVWPRPTGHRVETRLNRTDARLMAGVDRRVTLRVRIDQEHYLEGYAMFLSGSGGDDHWDHLHAEAFSFGLPYDPTAEIIAVDGSDFLVDYSTELTEEILEQD